MFQKLNEIFKLSPFWFQCLKISNSSLSVSVPCPLVYCSIHMKMMEESGGHLVCSRQVWLPVVLIGQTMWCTTRDLDIHTTRWCACFGRGPSKSSECMRLLCKKFPKEILRSYKESKHIEDENLSPWSIKSLLQRTLFHMWIVISHFLS